MLGKQVSQQGYKVCLSSYVVENVVWEPNLKAAYLHTLRWARTVRSVQPLGFACSFITDTLPLAVLFIFISHFSAAGVMVLAATLAARILLHYLIRNAAIGITGPARPWLIPAQDCMRFAVWAMSFLGSNVHWRGRIFAVSSSGQLAFKSAEKT